ncbi:STAS domain-containing protein [Peribacillus glennii]|uniref:STAS domain-containing protein n=1 Tax=Peribacillus glennii TaxID=2303991 RepID=A0A372LEM2_9BACI|nr:STAS domain-containing protein [Peribacillus glennii]RFU64687.1 STAS domain-containing protein [Peribacillus glennii]
MGFEKVNSIKEFAHFLSKRAESISREIVNYNLSKLEITLPQEIIDKSIDTNAEFLKFLGITLKFSNEEVEPRFIEWLIKQETPEDAQYIEELSSLIKPYAETRQLLIKILSQLCIDHGLTTEEVITVTSRLSYFLDLSITETILKRERITKETKEKQDQKIRELSSPIIPIQNGIAVLPIIGDIDVEKSEFIMNRVIPRVTELKIECVIIDFSSIASIDTETAARIFTIYDVLRLLGINAVFTGIRTDLVSKIINSGINFPSIKTYATLQQALEDIG